jgi:hypothetical protein
MWFGGGRYMEALDGRQCGWRRGVSVCVLMRTRLVDVASQPSTIHHHGNSQNRGFDNAIDSFVSLLV